MATIQLNMYEGRQNRDAGINQAVANADKVNKGWSDKAYKMFVDWLEGWAPGYRFTIEQFRQVAQIRGLPDPPNNRAFGGLAVKAKFAGLIKSNGTVKVKNPKAHCANAACWEKI